MKDFNQILFFKPNLHFIGSFITSSNPKLSHLFKLILISIALFIFLIFKFFVTHLLKTLLKDDIFLLTYYCVIHYFSINFLKYLLFFKVQINYS